jgi:hypothetical protein
MGLNCCTANGPRGLLLLPAFAWMTRASQPVVNFYSEGRAEIVLASGVRVSIGQATDYPRDDVVKLTLDPPRKTRFSLDLRIPARCSHTTLSANGTALAPPQPGTYAHIDREWAPGDSVRLEFDLRDRMLHIAGRARGRAADSRLRPRRVRTAGTV